MINNKYIHNCFLCYGNKDFYLNFSSNERWFLLSGCIFQKKKKKERELRPDNNFIKPSDKKKNKWKKANDKNNLYHCFP